MNAVTVCAPAKLTTLADTGANMEPARLGFHKIVADILRRARAEDAAGIAWGLVCGPAVAEKTEVLEFREGVLQVRVPDEAWRASLAAFVPRYLELLNSMLSRKVEKIQLIPPEKPQPHKKGAG